MIDYKDQESMDSYLTPEELRYPVEEQQILIALRYLADNDDGCADKDHAGFSRIDGEFGRDLANKDRPFTAKQLLAAHKICEKYQRTQLAPAGIILPEDEAVQAVARRKEMQWTARQQQREAPASYDTGSKARVIGIKDGMLGVMFPPQSNDFQSNLSKIKAIQQEVEGLRLLNPTMPRVCFVDDKRDNKVFKYWQCPLEMLERVSKAFPDFKMTPDVQRFIDAEAGRKADEQRKIEEAQRAHRERVERLLGALGDLDAPIGDRVLYAHQKEAIRTLIEWNGGILAHDPGLGKTASGSMIAKAYMKAENCRVVVVGPKTLRANWVREAGWMGVPIEYFTHDSIPTDIPGKFVLIVDEAQAYQSRHAKRSKKFMELAWKAEAVICATGTPSKNGRPSNIYPLLLACKHPLVYAELSDGTPAHDQIKKLRLNFEKRYCAAQKTEYSQWDVTGAAFLEELHRKIVDTPRGVLRRRKDQCLDLPAKIRKLVPVELSKAEAESYRNEVSGMWNEYQSRVEAKIKEFKETKLPGKINQAIGDWLQETFSKEVLASAPDPHELVSAEELAAFKAKVTTLLLAEERTRIESGQALVMLGHFRHAGSKAKARATIDLIDSIFEEDAAEYWEAEREGRPHKNAAVIVFCAYKDTAAQIAEKFGVPVMSGDTPDKQRQPMVDAFQAGENRVFVGIYGAGGVGVTLTAANTVILVDRPWTPGEVEQAEDRAHRIGQDGAVICEWLQIPAEVNPVDAKIDAILQKKQENVVKMLDGGVGNYEPDLLFSNMAHDLLFEATHFKTGKEVEVGL